MLVWCQEENEVWDTLGEPSGKFDYLVKYSAPIYETTDPGNHLWSSNGWDDDPPCEFGGMMCSFDSDNDQDDLLDDNPIWDYPIYDTGKRAREELDPFEVSNVVLDKPPQDDEWRNPFALFAGGREESSSSDEDIITRCLVLGPGLHFLKGCK